jgi:hypothetical protein
MSTARLVLNVVGGVLILFVVIVGYQLTHPRMRDDAPNDQSGTRGIAGAIEKAAEVHTEGPQYLTQYAPAALTCFHPTGTFERVEAISVESSDVVAGTIFWHGGFGVSHTTRIRLHIPDEVSGAEFVAEIVEDNASVPALLRSCQVARRR